MILILQDSFTLDLFLIAIAIAIALEESIYMYCNY